MSGKIRFLLIAALVLTLTVGAAAAQSDRLSKFDRYSEYQVYVDGSHDSEAMLYRSLQPVAFLIVSPNLPAGALLVPVKQSVESVPKDQIASHDAVSAQLRSGFQSTAVGSFVVHETVDFQFSDRSVQLRPKPDLLRQHTAAEIKEYDAGYGIRAAQYRPDASLVKELGEVSSDVQVTIYFGSWCRFCQTYVPHLMRLEEALGKSSIHFSYYGLPRNFDLEPVTKAAGIERVPTAVVSVNGKEVGRLIGNDCQKPEIKLREVLAAFRNSTE